MQPAIAAARAAVAVAVTSDLPAAAAAAAAVTVIAVAAAESSCSHRDHTSTREQACSALLLLSPPGTRSGVGTGLSAVSGPLETPMGLGGNADEC